VLGEFHMLFANNSSYGKSSMTFTLRNSSPNYWVGSWEFKYHLLVLGYNNKISSLAVDLGILEEASRT
jgi:hypothetical protein